MEKPSLSGRKRKKGSIVIGNQIFTGRINQHRKTIRREPEAIYNALTDFNQFKQLVPMEEISIERTTPGEFHLGTRHRFTLRFRIQLEWETEVIHFERNRRIVSRFLNGIFEGGVEAWDLIEMDSEIEVVHTLVYQIKRWIYRVGWFLLGGEKKHNELTELTLSRIKSLLEGEGILH